MHGGKRPIRRRGFSIVDGSSEGPGFVPHLPRGVDGRPAVGVSRSRDVDMSWVVVWISN